MLKKILLMFFVFSFFGISSILSEETKAAYESVLGKRKIKSESDKKIQKIEQIIYSYFTKGSDIGDERTKEMIIKQVIGEYPLTPGKKPVEVNIAKIRKIAEKKANEKYPLTDKELEDRFKKEAGELYKALPLNTNVTISYKQGPYTKTVTGRYFGLTYYNDGVNIENTIIPIFDMSDSDKSKFDEKLREIRKKQYVESQVETYHQEKKNFSDGIVRAKADEAIKINEKNGFIYEWSKWRTPEDVTDIIITYVLDKKKKKEEQVNQSSDTSMVQDRKTADYELDQVKLNENPIDSGIVDQAPMQPSEEEKEGW